MITRSSLCAENSLLDERIAELNGQKAENFNAYREQLEEQRKTKGEIAAEITGCKKAFRRLDALKKNGEKVLDQDALVDEIVLEIQRKETSGTNPAIARDARKVDSKASAAIAPTKQTANDLQAAVTTPTVTHSNPAPSFPRPQTKEASGEAASITPPSSLSGAASSITDDIRHTFLARNDDGSFVQGALA